MSSDKMPDFKDLLRTAEQLQDKMRRVQEELAKIRVEGSAGGGMVVAVANGRQKLVSVQIEPEAVDPRDIPMLQDLVVAAVNQAMTKAQEVAQQEMAKATGQLNLQIPGMGG